MSNANKPRQNDQDKDGIPDSSQSQAQGGEGIEEREDDEMPGRETHVSSNPVIINR